MRILSSYFLFVILLLSSCSDHDDSTNPGTNPDGQSSGQLELSFTDAPIDNAEVSSCFVTIAEIQVDGQRVEGFQKTTIDLLAYQEGNVFTTNAFEVTPGTYGNISFTLDFEQDAEGNSPGCYVARTDGTKDQLSSTNSKITLNHNTLIEAEKKTSVVADFDLRKSIYLEDDHSVDGNYEFVNETELQEGIRIVNRGETGIIKGKVEGKLSVDGAIVVYLYEKGTFNQNTELTGQGSSNLMFKNAISSVKTHADGNFSLHFINEGDYELYFASYKEDERGHLQFEGVFSINAILDQLDPVEVSLTSNTTTTLNISLSGLISL